MPAACYLLLLLKANASKKDAKALRIVLQFLLTRTWGSQTCDIGGVKERERMRGFVPIRLQLSVGRARRSLLELVRQLAPCF